MYYVHYRTNFYTGDLRRAKIVRVWSGVTLIMGLHDEMGNIKKNGVDFRPRHDTDKF